MMVGGFSPWTQRQRRALLAILTTILIALCIQLSLHPAFVSDPPATEESRAAELADRIDPNVADAQTLAALPTLGEKRAKLIIDERESYRRLLPRGGPAFQKVEDLLRIRGIGVSTIEQLRPFLKFPTTSATTTATTTAIEKLD